MPAHQGLCCRLRLHRSSTRTSAGQRSWKLRASTWHGTTTPSPSCLRMVGMVMETCLWSCCAQLSRPDVHCATPCCGRTQDAAGCKACPSQFARRMTMDLLCKWLDSTHASTPSGPHSNLLPIDPMLRACANVHCHADTPRLSLGTTVCLCPQSWATPACAGGWMPAVCCEPSTSCLMPLTTS